MDDRQCLVGQPALRHALVRCAVVFGHEQVDLVDRQQREPQQHAFHIGIGDPKKVLMDLVRQRAIRREPDGAVGGLSELGSVATSQ